jgi:hypothetical protein
LDQSAWKELMLASRLLFPSDQWTHNLHMVSTD